MDKTDLKTFKCNSVAAKIDSPALWAGLERLWTNWVMDKTDLKTFMCGSVAAKIV